MKIAFFSPLAPQRSGISDYSEGLLPYLAAGADIDLFIDGFKPTNETLLGRFKCFDYRADPGVLKQLARYDAALYHMGNDHRYHGGICDAIRSFPGVVVFHDFSLQDFFWERARERDDRNIYLDELEACHGKEVRAEAEAKLAGGAVPSFLADPIAFPLNCRVANSAEALIVHSEWARGRLARLAPGVPIEKINHFVAPDHDPYPSGQRDGQRQIEIASFGYINEDKGIEKTLRVLATLRQNHAFHYTLVGEPLNFDVLGLADSYGLSKQVTVTGYISPEEFQRRIAATDIAINLRERTMGETSGSACRAMAAGLPVVVSNIGWFAELPDDAVIKIGGRDDDSILRAYVDKLMEDAPLRKRIGANARRYMLSAHAVEDCAAAYLDFLQERGMRKVRRQLIRRVSTELSLLGIHGEDDGLLHGLAAEVAALTDSAGDHGREHAKRKV